MYADNTINIIMCVLSDVIRTTYTSCAYGKIGQSEPHLFAEKVWGWYDWLFKTKQPVLEKQFLQTPAGLKVDYHFLRLRAFVLGSLPG